MKHLFFVIVPFLIGVAACAGPVNVTPLPTSTATSVPDTATPTSTPSPVATVNTGFGTDPQAVGTPFSSALLQVFSLTPSPTPITLRLAPSNVELRLVPTPTNTPTPSTPTAIPTFTPVPANTSVPTPTQTPVPTATPLPVQAVGTVDIDIILPFAPNGIGGFEFNIVTGPEVLLLGALSPSMSLFSINGNQVAAVDTFMIVEPGAVNVKLVIITLEAVQVGTTRVEVVIVKLDDDVGDPINARIDLGMIMVVQ